MRGSLRSILIIAMTPATLATLGLAAAIVADLAFLQSDLIRFRNAAIRAIESERLGSQIEALLSQSYQVTLEGSAHDGAGESLAALQSDIAHTLDRLAEVVAPLEPAGATPRELLTQEQHAELGEAQSELERYLERTSALARQGRGGEARRLIANEVEVLARARLRDPIGRVIHGEGSYLEEYSARVNRGAEHWLMRATDGDLEVPDLLPEVFEAILAQRFARYVQSEYRSHLQAVSNGSTPDSNVTRSLASSSRRALGQLAGLRGRTRADDEDVAAEVSRAEAALASAEKEMRERYARIAALDASQIQTEGFDQLREIGALIDRVLQPQTDVVVAANQRSISARMAQLDGFTHRILAACFAVAALGLLIAVAVPMFTTRLLVRPIRLTIRAIRRREDDDAEPLTLPKASGELGELIRCIGGMASQLEESSRKVRALAFYDTTTGLANRRFFLERLRSSLVAARVGNRIVGLLSLSIEGLPGIVETFGHEAGDDVLRQVADRLGKSVRMSDVVSRPGERGESLTEVSRMSDGEFNVLLTRISDAQDASKVADRILGEFFRPFTINGRDSSVSACIGIGVFPVDGGDADSLMRNVGAALNHAQARGSNHFQFCSEAMNAAAARRQHLRARLAECIDQGQLDLHFQPVRSTQTGDITAAEALLRWTDPDLGPVSPAEFIPIAEETGLIDQLGEWILRRACEKIREWEDRGFQPIRISVNVSANQLKDEGFVHIVAQVIAKHRLSPGLLELEITETAMMSDDQATTDSISKLALMGVSIVLDDFGTGYSSLAYLKRFPIHRLKIDRSFVSEITDEGEGTALCQAILAMARSLGMPVVAEGVETLKQAEFFQHAQCEEIQGFLISRAVPCDEFERHLVSIKSSE